VINKLVFLSLIVSVLLVNGCSSDDRESGVIATPVVGNSVYDNIVNNTDLSILRSAIDAAGLDDSLDYENISFTVFAPTNSAFIAFDQSRSDLNFLSNLESDPSSIQDILTPLLSNHVLPVTIDSDTILSFGLNSVVAINEGDIIGLDANGISILATVDDARDGSSITETVTTIDDMDLTLGFSSTSPAFASIEGIDIAIADSNFDPDSSVGVVHIIDQVIVPSLLLP